MYEAEQEAIQEYMQRLNELRACLRIDEAKEKIAALESSMAEPGFWDIPDSAQKIVQELKGYKSHISAPDELQSALEDAEVLVEMAVEEEDVSMEAEVASLQKDLKKQLDRLELTSLFSDPRDAKAALVSIHPGAGGTESCDWADMLYRMLTRFCESHEFTYEILEYQPGDEAGIKSVTLRISGINAYGTLKSESGVHRLVRISPFDSASRRHTSFTAIEVLTEVDEDIEIEVREEDLKMDVFRASGAGGQHINKTSSAVRLTHIPTGTVVACQMERSQHRNKATAVAMIKAKLYDEEMKKQEAELNAQRDDHQDVAWGSQIRSYVLHPYQMIKDHRTNVETGNVNKVLDGELDLFIEAFLKWKLQQHSN